MGNVTKLCTFTGGLKYWLAKVPQTMFSGLPAFTEQEAQWIESNLKELERCYAGRMADYRFRVIPVRAKDEPAPATLFRDKANFSCSHCGQSGVVDAIAPDGYRTIFRCSCEWFGPNFKFSQPISTWIPGHFPLFKPKYWDVKAEGVPVKVMHKVIDNGLQPFPF